jgi:hypothetical protein
MAELAIMLSDFYSDFSEELLVFFVFDPKNFLLLQSAPYREFGDRKIVTGASSISNALSSLIALFSNRVSPNISMFSTLG